MCEKPLNAKQPKTAPQLNVPPMRNDVLMKLQSLPH
jgi:hypothetical protein